MEREFFVSSFAREPQNIYLFVCLCFVVFHPSPREREMLKQTEKERDWRYSKWQHTAMIRLEIEIERKTFQKVWWEYFVSLGSAEELEREKFPSSQFDKQTFHSFTWWNMPSQGSHTKKERGRHIDPRLHRALNLYLRNWILWRRTTDGIKG